MDIKICFIIIVSVLFFSCGNQRDANIISESTSLPETPVVVKSTDHYLAYLPDDLESDQEAPMLLIFDPQGNPKIIMEQLKSVVIPMGWRMAGSLKSRNGNDETPQIVNDFLQEVQHDFPVENNYLVACGFSGGARVAEYAALSYPDVSALILAGAGPSATGIFAQQNIVTTVIAGTHDFNFNEAYTADMASQQQDIVVFLYHEGMHSWPESTLLKAAIYRTALAWDMKNEGVDFNANMSEIAAEMKTRYLNHPWLKMQWENFYASINGNNSDVTEDPGITNRLQALLVSEQELRQQFVKALTQKDHAWWERELKTLSFKKNAEPAGLKKDMYHRFSGFLGVASFSLANNYVQQNRWQDLQHVLQVYQMVEPDNPDMYYFKARLFQEKNNTDSAKFFAKKAMNAGYQDTAKLKMEF